MQLANIDIGKLFVSKTNMRHAEKNPDVSDILPSVRARGVIVPLIVRPGDDEGQPDSFGIVAGSRRRRAAELALSEGIDHGPLPCAIMEPGDDAAALEASLIENIQRLDPDEVSQWETFTRLIEKEKRTVEAVCQTFGVTELYVRRILALANLLPRIRKLYRQGEINVATIRHLTLASKTQQKDWLALFDSPDDYAPTGAQLKAWLFGGESISTKAAIFPLEDYKGRIVGDLFEQDGFFADSDAFWTAQNQAIAAKRDAYLEAGWADVEIMEPGQWFYAHEHEETPKAKGGKVFIAVRPNGAVEIHEGWLSGKEARKARAEAAKATTTEADRQAARDQRSETTSALQTYIDLHRHAAARAVLADHPAVALRLMVAHAITGSPLWTVKVEKPYCRNEAILESVETGAAETRFDEKRRAVLALLDFSAEEATVAGGNGKSDGTAVIFARLLTLSDADVLAIIAIVMGETMEAGSAVVEAVGNYLAVDMASLWTPDDAFFDLIRDRQVVNAMLREIGGKKVADGNITEKVKTQKGIIRDHLAGANQRPKVDGWTPKWLRFPAASYTARPFVTLGRWKAVERNFKNLPSPVEIGHPDAYAIAAE
ncbi:MAG TPA: ParB/RepB/Spo0J family partition protein [Sphingomonadaceae bacterium]|nr:ParB/RepB/Spo0J family partition protein [Sphingomonadaceae bacterium]